MWILIDKNGIELKLGDIVADFRGTEWTLCGFTPPRHSNSTGRVHVQRITREGVVANADFYPSVVNATITRVPAHLQYAFGINDEANVIDITERLQQKIDRLKGLN